MKLLGWPVLPPCPRHDRGPALLAAQPKRGGQRAPTAAPLFSSPSNPFFVCTWNILLQEGSCSSLFPGVFLQADHLAGLVTTENPRGFCL